MKSRVRDAIREQIRNGKKTLEEEFSKETSKNWRDMQPIKKKECGVLMERIRDNQKIFWESHREEFRLWGTSLALVRDTAAYLVENLPELEFEFVEKEIKRRYGLG